MMQQSSTQSIRKHLILGGARSGKSRFAESQVSDYLKNDLTRNSPIYLATAEALDEEMKQRILRHQQDRSKTQISWQVIEETIEIAKVIKSLKNNDIVLIECLTLWLNNCLHQNNWEQQKALFIEALDYSNAHIIMVSNEVGLGITPTNSLARKFIDEAGRMHQELAQICNKVSLVTAGIAQSLK